MKKLLVLPVLLLTTVAFAQKISDSKVPEAVKAAFSKNFSGMNEVKWEKEKGNYEANFNKDKTKMSALFDKEGKLLETETGIPVTKLPKAVLTYLGQQYDGKQIKEAARIKKEDGTLNYEADVDGNELLFGEAGQLISKTKAH
jgi:hypothetical protein